MNTLAAETASAWYLTLQIAMSAIWDFTAYKSWDGDPIMKRNTMSVTFVTAPDGGHNPGWPSAKGHHSSTTPQPKAGVCHRVLPKSAGRFAQVSLSLHKSWQSGIPNRIRSCVVRSDSWPRSPPIGAIVPAHTSCCSLHSVMYLNYRICSWKGSEKVMGKCTFTT